MGVWLIAPLGGQPQVITLTLDLLLSRDEGIDQVVVMFPGGHSRYLEAHRRLQREFAEYPLYRHIRYQAYPLVTVDERPLGDIRDSLDADQAWQAASQIVGEAKRQGHRLHISLSGGRRVLALMLFSAAMLYGMPNDRAWHIHTPPEVLDQVKDGARLHVPPESGVQLLEIPFAPWGAYFPGLRQVLGLPPQEVLTWRAQWPDEETAQRCRFVWLRLTERQRKVLRALVEQPTRRAAAEILGLSLSTLDTHRAAILEACRLAWPEERVNLAFVRRTFRRWFLAGSLSS